MKWGNIPSKELDSKLSEFIATTKSDFVTIHDRILIKSHILDNGFRDNLSQAFTRLAPKYIDTETEEIIRSWERMTDEELEQEFTRIHENKGKDGRSSVWPFIYPDDLKLRFERVLFSAIPKIRHIDLLRMLKRWESLSDEDLATEIKAELFGTGLNSSTSHFTFVRDLYPNINNDILRKRVDKFLLSSMDPRMPVDSDMALYACSHLDILGTLEAYQELIRQTKLGPKKI